MPQEFNECMLYCTKLYACIVLHYTIHENEDTQVTVLHMYQCFKQNMYKTTCYMYVTLDNLQIFISLLYNKNEEYSWTNFHVHVYTPDHFSVLLLFYLCIGVAFFYPGSLTSCYCPGRGRSHTIQTVCNHRASNVLGPSSQRKHSRT